MTRSTLYVDILPTQKPIVYHKDYNIAFMGIQKLHTIDTQKWGHVFEMLKEAKVLDDDSVVSASEATAEELLLVHKKKYLSSLKWSFNVALIAELLPLCVVPNFLLQRHFLKPMRMHTGGSILAGKLAIDHKWAINIGGGFHHCCATKGRGFCAYADITLLIENLFRAKLVNNAMILDLDAHQGNGYQRDFMGNSQVYIMDMYNSRIWPKDKFAKQAIHRKVELRHHTKNSEYMKQLKINLLKSLEFFKPDIIVYNAGTDILEDDPLGNMDITPEGVIERDEYVFKTCKLREIPIVMLTSGGYTNTSAAVIAASITNLHNKAIIQ